MPRLENVGAYPVAVGGVGGSGTRVVAAFLDMIGYYIGDDLNTSLDNLWFTLLFKRRSILVEDDREFNRFSKLFFDRMSGKNYVPEEDYKDVFRLAERNRPEHSTDWLKQRAGSFCKWETSKYSNQPWGWKEPNTHISIERFLISNPNLRYIHVVRNPIYMSESKNQNQLRMWGAIFLDSDVNIEPRSSLSYWCEAHRRVAALMRRWSDRTLLIDYDALVAAPDLQGDRIANFLSANLPDPALPTFRDFVQRSAPTVRVKAMNPRHFDAADLAYVSEIGYPL